MHFVNASFHLKVHVDLTQLRIEKKIYFILHRDPISSRETQNDYLFPLCLLEKAIMISYVIDNGYLKINIVTQLNTICSLLYDFRHGKSSKMSAIGLLGNENVHSNFQKCPLFEDCGCRISHISFNTHTHTLPG